MATNGLVVMTPTSTAVTGTGASATINADGSVTFSSCATLSLNEVFTSSYDNYMIVVRNLGSQGDYVYLRLRVSGTDNSTASSYVYQELSANSTTVAGSRTTANTTKVYDSEATQRDGATIYLYGPFLAQPTAGRSTTVSGYVSGSIYDYAFTHNQSTSYDGITLYPGAGNVTGLVTVYGFNQ